MLTRIVTVTATGLALASPAAANEMSINFTLDWSFEGPAAPYFLAIDNGHFADQGLDVEISAGEGSLDAIPKVASGAYPIGFADMASMIKFLDANEGAPVTAVMMIYDAPAFAIVGRHSLGVSEPADLEGRTLGAPPPDGAWAQFPAFASANDLDVDAITVEEVGFPTREPMLAQGNVDAITGFSFTSFLNLRRQGVDEDDISVMQMSDYGLELYGNAIIVNTDFAAENPEAVTGFLTAVVAGLRDTIADPESGISAIADRNPAIDEALELERLELALDNNIVTDWVREHGLGGIDEDRFARALEQIEETHDFQRDPTPELYFTSEFLPEDRMLD